VKLGTFRPFPTPHSSVRTAGYDVKLGTFRSFAATAADLVLSQYQQPEKAKMLVGKTGAFPLPGVIVLR
jgi:hypothetical protein